MRLFTRIWYRLIFSWGRNTPCSKEVDEWFREQLKNPVFTFCEGDLKHAEYGYTPYVIKLNGVKVWVANKYYASPYVYVTGGGVLPFMDTTVLFFKAYDKFLKSIKLPLKDIL